MKLPFWSCKPPGQKTRAVEGLTASDPDNAGKVVPVYKGMP